jgi:hypothetical protein
MPASVMTCCVSTLCEAGQMATTMILVFTNLSVHYSGCSNEKDNELRLKE